MSKDQRSRFIATLINQYNLRDTYAIINATINHIIIIIFVYN